ncbi:M50 family metallopeptidase [Luteococcus sp. Sow4_B9]|uniref:M50 family metallopeptidase n=1 Tax=Luteococcus sp. Sow4_B9 TaxID=3438792 RepID=UPI003F978283
MTLLVSVVAALLFFGLVMASIALHEVGHLLPAKLFGVKVTQYFVGFGRTVWQVRRGETHYGIKAIPLGGYVRMVGMYPPRRPGQAESRGPVARLADEARDYEYEDITSADDGRLFHQKPVWQKVIVMAGGPAMNLLLAFLIFLGINLVHGQYRPQMVAAQVSECVVPASREVKTCTDADPASPAKAAGVQVGDRIVSFNGERPGDWNELSASIRANGAGSARLVVERDGQQLTLPVVNTIVTGMADRLDPARTVEVGFLGVTPAHELVRGGVGTTAGDVWMQTKQSVTALARFPVKVWNVGADLVTGQGRDENGPISIVGASRVAGEIAGNGQMAPDDKIASWFAMLGSLNLFVCLLNCVPLPPLDGGHIAGALYEGLRRAVARAFGRSDPGPVDTAKLLPVAYLVGGFLFLAGIVLIIADLFSPVAVF